MEKLLTTSGQPVKHEEPTTKSVCAKMVFWAVYDHPSDDPGMFVARKWNVGNGYAEASLVTIRDQDLDRLRDGLLALGLHRIPRSANDDPVIIETWL